MNDGGISEHGNIAVVDDDEDAADDDEAGRGESELDSRKSVHER